LHDLVYLNRSLLAHLSAACWYNLSIAFCFCCLATLLIQSSYVMDFVQIPFQMYGLCCAVSHGPTT